MIRTRRPASPGWVRWLVALACASSPGCYLQHSHSANRDAGHDAGPEARLDGGHDARADVLEEDTGPRRVDPRDSGPGDAGEPVDYVCETTHEVDMLIVLDDSGSLRPYDALVRDRLERIIGRLLNPPDLDGDGRRDWGRVQDVHLGVVTTSVAGPPFCEGTRDGALMSGEPANFDHCGPGPYPAYVEHGPGDDPIRSAQALSCVAFGPRDGCTVEQPLEAMAKALLPHGSPFAFAAGEPRGDTSNAGFLREDSVLVVLLISDEDDCSALDPSIFEVPEWPDSGPARGAPGCLGATPAQLQDVQRYVDVLSWLRPTHPERVVFVFLGAIGPALTTSFEHSLGACRRGDYPRRIIDFARALDGRALGASLCELGDNAVTDGIVRRIADAACE